jgi:hypothetical protein
MSDITRVPKSDWPIAYRGNFRHLYVIEEEGGPIKIGIAANAFWRLIELQTGNHRKLALRAVFQGEDKSRIRAIEGWLHIEYAYARIAGEWFAISAPAAIKKIEERFY